MTSPNHVLAHRVHLAAMSAMSVLISMGAVLGKANLVQLAVMALVEVTAFGAFRMLTRSVFQVSRGAVCA